MALKMADRGRNNFYKDFLLFNPLSSLLNRNSLKFLSLIVSLIAKHPIHFILLLFDWERNFIQKLLKLKNKQLIIYRLHFWEFLTDLNNRAQKSDHKYFQQNIKLTNLQYWIFSFRYEIFFADCRHVVWQTKTGFGVFFKLFFLSICMFIKTINLLFLLLYSKLF